MDEEAEAFVIENEEVMHDDDGPGGDDEMNYVEEDTSVNTEEECDEEEIVVDLVLQILYLCLALLKLPELLTLFLEIQMAYANGTLVRSPCS